MLVGQASGRQHCLWGKCKLSYDTVTGLGKWEGWHGQLLGGMRIIEPR